MYWDWTKKECVSADAAADPDAEDANPDAEDVDPVAEDAQVAFAQTHAQTESSHMSGYAGAAFGFVAGAATMVLIGTCSKKASREN